jgi:pimeloyl-ACP methyl ester carboxylesterase
MPEKTVRPRKPNRTNVRLYFRLGMRALALVAPAKAEKVALDLFGTPRRPRRPSDPAAGLPGERFTVQVGPDTVAAWSWGQGPTVVLTHGWSGHAGQMASFVAPLVKAGYRAVAFDHPAHGQSGGRRATYDLLARSLATVVEQVGPVAAVVAHSLGATGTILALTRGLPVDRVVLVAPPAEPPTYARAFGRAIGLPPARIEGMIERIRILNGGSLDSLDSRRLVPQLRARALVIHDPDDPEVPFAHGAAIAEAWPGSRLERAPGLGHHRVLRDPGVIDAAVAFVRGYTEPPCEVRTPSASSA